MKRTSDAQIRVKPHDTSDVDPATVAADLNWAATKLSLANEYRRGLERAAEIVEAEPELPGDLPLSVIAMCQRPSGVAKVIRAAVKATKRNITAAIRKEIGAKDGK